MLSVQHNLFAMNASRQTKIVSGKKAKHTEKLSSGYRINRAADDAAGLSISEKMRRQIRGLTQASQNCSDGISMVQTADGALAEVHDMLHRGTELSIKAANGTLTQEDRDYIQEEIAQLKTEIDSISDRTTFNEIKILRGGITETTGENKVIITGDMPTWVGLSSTTQLEDDFVTDDFQTTYKYTDPDPAIGDTTIDLNIEHAGASVDFSAFTGTQDQIDELVGNGFHTTCCTCDAHYSIQFTNETTSSVETSGINYIYKVGIGDLQGKTGEDLVNRILSATNGGLMTDHYTNLKANPTNLSELLVYDVRPSKTRNELFPTGATDITYPGGVSTDTSFGTVARPTSGMGKFGPGYAEADLNAITTSSTPTKIDIQAGAEAGQHIEIILPSISTAILGISNTDVSSVTGADNAITSFKNAVEHVSRERSRMGAYQNRLEHTIQNLDNIVENTTNAESVIRDTDMASEMVSYSNTNILQQAGNSILAQANQSSQNILALLG